MIKIELGSQEMVLMAGTVASKERDMISRCAIFLCLRNWETSFDWGLNRQIHKLCANKTLTSQGQKFVFEGKKKHIGFLNLSFALKREVPLVEYS